MTRRIAAAFSAPDHGEDMAQGMDLDPLDESAVRKRLAVEDRNACKQGVSI
jgi:hypothetical protein